MKRLSGILLLLTIFAIYFNNIVRSQPIQEWAVLYSSNSIWTTGLSIDSSENLILAGNINGQRSFIVKYDRSGNQLWSTLIPDIPVAYSSRSNIVIENNNIYISGQNITNVVTKKFNSNGINVWTRSFSLGTYSLGGNSIGIDKNSNIYICQGEGGFVESGINLIKYDTSGNILWKKKCKGFLGYVICDMNLDKLNNVIIASSIYENSDNFITIKYNENGDSLWSSYYRTSAIEMPFASVIDESQNVFVTGESERFWDGTHGKLITIKYDLNGTQKWVRNYHLNSVSMDRGLALTIDKSGSIIVAGRSRSLNGDLDFVIIKYSQAGDSLWVRRYNGEAGLNDEPNSIITDSIGNIYVTGYRTNAFNTKEIITLKYDINGNLLWSVKYDNQLNNIGHYLVKDQNNSIYVAGSNSVNSNGIHTVCIKYSQPIGISSNHHEIPVSYRLYNAYPNPFNPVTNIKYEIPKDVNVSIKIYDILVREVFSLNEYKKAGSYEVQFDGSNFASGMYFYKLEADGFSDTKKMVLLK